MVNLLIPNNCNVNFVASQPSSVILPTAPKTYRQFCLWRFLMTSLQLCICSALMPAELLVIKRFELEKRSTSTASTCQNQDV